MSETSKFTEDILAAARAKAQSIIGEAENQTRQASEEAKTVISREVGEIIQNARADAEAVKRREISEARHRSKLQEQKEKSTILSEVLEKTRNRISDMARDQTKYLPYLTNLIETGVRELGDDVALIHLNQADLSRINISNLEKEIGKQLGKECKIEWSKEPIEALGGAIVSSIDGKARIVNTIDQRFDALEPKLLIEAGKSLFGE